MKYHRSHSGFTLNELIICLGVIAFLFFLLVPRNTGCKGSASRIACVNNLKQVGLGFRVWAGDHQDAYPMAVSITNGGAMEAVLSGDVASVFRVLSNELNTPKILHCPTDQNRISASVFDPIIAKQGGSGGIPFVGNTNLSYFVGVEAAGNLPSTFLAGDDNLVLGGRPLNGVALPETPSPRGLLTITTNTPIGFADTRHKKAGNVALADGSVQGFTTHALRIAVANTGLATNRLAMP